MQSYWTAEIYGFGKWIRRYGYYPNWLPLCIYNDHGAGYKPLGPAPHELKSAAPVQFYHSMRNVEEWKRLSDKPCFNLYSPFVFARKKLKIKKSLSASGVLYFLAHSTSVVVDLKTAETYREELSNIQGSLGPVTICLHMHDVDKGLNKVYEAMGYNVITAGNTSSQDFPERFYRILANYNYVVSNLIGSYTYYAVEMGIPFGLYGTPPYYYNYSDENIEKGHYKSYFETPFYRDAISLFAGFQTEISIEQKEFVKEGLGLSSGVSRFKMAVILYRSFLICLFRKENYKQVLKAFKKKLTKVMGIVINKILNFNLRVLFTKLGFIKAKAEKITFDKLIDNNDYQKLMDLPRFTKHQVTLLGRKITFSDNLAFTGMIDEIFLKKNYEFIANSPNPYIIDCGANIGIADIFFKTLYPDAKVLAIEADPGIHQILSDNMHSYGFANVSCLNAAVWTKDEELFFEVDNSWGGHIGQDPQKNSVKVQAIDFNKLLLEPVDFLKMDIEGAETDVLLHSKELIAKNVKNIFFEWHSISHKRQQLGEILEYFSSNGFRYHIKEASSKASPFLEKRLESRMDAQLDCFLYKV